MAWKSTCALFLACKGAGILRKEIINKRSTHDGHCESGTTTDFQSSDGRVFPQKYWALNGKCTELRTLEPHS